MRFQRRVVVLQICMILFALLPGDLAKKGELIISQLYNLSCFSHVFNRLCGLGVERPHRVRDGTGSIHGRVNPKTLTVAVKAPRDAG